MVIISEPADGGQFVKMTVMGKRRGGATISQCRYVESLGAFCHHGERQAPAHQDERPQELISPFGWPWKAPEVWPSWLDWAFRGPLGLSNSHQVTNGPRCIPMVPPAWPHPLCSDSEILHGSVAMNQFSLFVATSGFCWLSVPKQLSVGSDRSQR